MKEVTSNTFIHVFLYHSLYIFHINYIYAFVLYVNKMKDMLFLSAIDDADDIYYIVSIYYPVVLDNFFC